MSIKTHIRLIALCLAALLQTSCSLTRTTQQPAWINNSNSLYANTQYLTATGSASNIEQARDRALANLAKIFSSRIQENSTLRSDTQVQIQNRQERVSKNKRLTQNIFIQTDRVIEGARIAESWQNPTDFTFYALAILNRQQAANNLRQEINRLDENTRQELSHARTQTDALLSMAAISRAVDLQQQRQSLQKSLQIIDLRGRAYPAEWQMASLQQQLRDKLRQLSIASGIDHDPSGQLTTILQAAMGNAGFPPVTTAANYQLIASLSIQDIGLRQKWYWLRGQLSLRLEDAEGKIRGRQQWSLKSSALEKTEAEKRLLLQAAEKLNQQIKTTLISFATDTK